MSIEAGARAGMIAPDDATFAYLAGRPYAPKGALWDRAVADWRTLPSDADAAFDREIAFDAGEIAPMVTWGTSPEDVGADHRPGPRSRRGSDAERRAAHASGRSTTWGSRPARRSSGIAVDRVFIGSCTNSRIEDLRAAARVRGGRRVAAGVAAMVVPGSEPVKRQAEAEGLDRDLQATPASNGARPAARCASA